MADILHLKARDVCSVFLILVLWTAGMTVQAQSIGARKVTCAFQATRLDEVIRHLSLEAGVSFIYSSNKTDLNKVVTLTVDSRPLEETLNLIGSQIDLEFKMQGRYVMIKPLPSYADVKAARSMAGRVPVAHTVKTPKHSLIAYYHAQTPDRTMIPSFVERELPSFNTPFINTAVSPVTLGEARAVSPRIFNAGWFMSVGPVFSDFSSGLEVQAGIRSAYLVFTPSWMSGARYHYAFGVGTSVPLAKNLALTPVYLMGNASSTSVMRWRNVQGITEMKQTERMTHHQIKLMFQYEVNPAVMIKLGPTFNQSNTKYNSYQTTSTLIQRRTIIPPVLGDGVSAGYETGDFIVVDQVESATRSSLLSEQRVRKAWLGWEASVAVKVNFSRKK